MKNTSESKDQLTPLQRAVVALKEMRSKLDETERLKTEPIAIVGMSCRFPGGADDPEKFWELLRNGVDAITEVPADRWNINEYYNSNPNIPGKMYTRYGGFVQQVDQFDPHFFGISSREAASMDPQQRLLLEVSWEALENGGQAPEHLNGSKTGVFMGLFMDDYSRFNLYSGDPNQIDAYSSLGNARSIAVGRIAYILGLQGPVLQLDTACSSALLAVHLACHSLRAGECNLALAGGVNLILAPEASIGLSKMRALAPDGRCKTFDASADGYGRGEGCGIVMLKRVSDAIANNDRILAIIRGSAVNHDGHSSGLTVPNGLAQEALIRSALKSAKVEPLQISYVETHGTGTSLGDPIEVRALGSVLCEGRTPEQPLRIGSVKTQVGHLESAAGVASLMKVVLALQHAEIPPHLHLKQPTPHIPWDTLPIVVPTQPTKWSSTDGRLLAGVSSFGISGTNVHVVVEEAPETKLVQPKVERPLHLLSLSAKTESALLSLANRYESFLISNPEASLADICFTANTGRSHFEHRLCVVTESTVHLREQLGAFATQKSTAKLLSGQVQNKRPKIVFLFTGQGSQYVGMGRQLYETQHTFRKVLDRCDEILRPYLAQPLLSVLYPESDATLLLHETAYTQPALFALEYALAELWKSWGIVPDAVMGHSVGEYVAACVAGVFSLEDGLKLIAERGRLIQSLPQDGMMAAVFTNEAQMTSVLAPYAGRVVIAGVNGPDNIVISGVTEGVQEVLEELKSTGINAQPLKVSHAFHSHLMQSILENFEDIARSVKFQAPRIPLISNLTGKMLSSLEIPDATYWRHHLREAVRFFAGIETLQERGYDFFVEVGSSSTLIGMGKRCLPQGVGTWLPSLKKGQEDWLQLLSSLGELYVRGATINWCAFDQDYQRYRMALPTYPFQRQRCWVERNEPQRRDGSIDVASPTGEERLEEKACVNTTISVSAPPEWFYTWQWRSEELVEFQEISTGAILIFKDRDNVGENLERRFGSGNATYFVTPGESFKHTGQRNFTINPASSEDYEQLINVIKEDGFAVTAAVHLWNYSLWGVSAEQLLENDDVLNESVYSILFLAQALVKNDSACPLNLLLVTQGAYTTSPTESIQGLHQSMAGAVAQVLALENLPIQAKTVDVTQEGLPPEKLADILFQEMKAAPSGEGIVALRNGQRLVRTLDRMDVPTNNDALLLAKGETWLITGGTSAVGTEIALRMARQVPINFVLTGRYQLPPRQEWENSDNDSSTKQRIQAIQELERLGSTVIYQAVDVTDAQGMQQLVENVRSRFGHLNGVIHAAGAVDNSTFKLLQKQPSSIAKVLAPKVQGTIILDAVTRNEPLKFFVMLSSVSASKKEWGSGMGDYAAANTFLDSYAVYRTQRGAQGRSLALNYSLWSNRGMGAILGSSTLLMVKSKGLNPLEPEPAADAFIKALSLAGSGVIHIIDLIAQSSTASTQKSSTSPTLTSKLPPSRNIRQLFREILVQHLAISEQQMEGYKTFQELGLDSVGTVEVVQHLGTALGVELFPTLLFEYQTPDDLIYYLEHKYGNFTKTIPTIVSLAETSTITEVKNQRLINRNVAEDAEREKGVEESFDGECVSHKDVGEQDIAIIGMACKVPGADNLEQYWDLLSQGRSAVRDVPTDRWFSQHYFEGNKASQTKISKRGCFVERPFDFDPMFFGISPKEATAMDPQQRLFLELAMQALQQAGYGGRFRTDNIGVFVGCGQNTYIEHFTNSQYYEALRQRMQESPWFSTLSTGDRQQLFETLSQVLQPSEILPESSAGNEVNELAARVSHCLNLKGPSMAVVTACSSSLVALHTACESLRSGQTHMAIAGGVNLNLSPSPFTFLSKAQALSPTGTCHPFDRRANGLVLGEGAGVLILKPVKQALADGDYIHAVIKGSAVNNDGHSQGITAPNPRGQAEAIRKAYISSGVDPQTISYIETHGTGTLLGDPVEVEGMTQAFRSFTEDCGFCAIGSVKSSIGHLLSASGIISLIKVVLAMRHGKIPQTLGFQEPNPHINFANTPFYVVSKSKDWCRNADPLRAGINGFGFGGTNCHVIIEESPVSSTVRADVKDSSPHLLVLTARNQQVLKEVAAQLREHIIQHPEQEVSQICFTENNAQRELPYKAALIVNNRQHLLQALNAICLEEKTPNIYTGRANPQRTTPIHLVLDGNSVIHPDEVEILGKHFPEFQQAYADCENHWVNAQQTAVLSKRAYTFAVQYAWGRWLMSLELQPTSLLVEETGILVGASLAGMLTLKQAMILLARLEEKYCINIADVATSEEQQAPIWTCPLVTSVGIFRYPDKVPVEKLAILMQASARLNAEDCREVISKEGVYLHPASSLSLKQQLGTLDEQGIWICLDKEQSPLSRLLENLARLYVAGVQFNSTPLFPRGLRRVLLPTYPFERKTYKPSLIHADDANQEVSMAPTGLVPLEQLSPLSPELRQSSYTALAIDLDHFGSSQDETQEVSTASNGLVRLEQISPLSPEERQSSYIALAKDLQKLGR